MVKLSPVNLMRISEFHRAAGVYQKRGLIACLGPLSLALVCILAYAPFQHRFESFLSSRLDTFTADVLTFLPMGLPLMIAFISMVPLARRVERQSGIACPHCAKDLASYKAIVIASRNCPHCGKRVIEDDN